MQTKRKYNDVTVETKRGILTRIENNSRKIMQFSILYRIIVIVLYRNDITSLL